jgi:hypothetical protein
MVIEATAAILADGVYITPLVICAHVKLADFERQSYFIFMDKLVVLPVYFNVKVTSHVDHADSFPIEVCQATRRVVISYSHLTASTFYHTSTVTCLYPYLSIAESTLLML